MKRVLIFSPSAYQTYGHTFDYVSGLTVGAAALGSIEVHVLGFDGPLSKNLPTKAIAHTCESPNLNQSKGSTLLKQIMWGARRIAHSKRLIDAAIELSRGLDASGVLFESFEYYSLARRVNRFDPPIRCIFHDTSFNSHQSSIPAALYKTAMANSAASIVNNCERVFVHGKMMRENLIRGLGLDIDRSQRITAIPYGAAMPWTFRHVEQEEARRSLGIPNDGPLLLAFGTLRRDKQFSTLLKAIALTTNWRILISGPEGDMKYGEIEALARSLKVSERVHFRNRFIKSDEQPSFFGAANVVAGIYSSAVRHESGTCQLARSFLKPIIVSGPPDLETYVENTGVGWTVPGKSPEALAKTLIAVENSTEDDLRFMIDRIARCAADRSWNRVCEQVFGGWN